MSSDTTSNNSHVYCKQNVLLLSTVEENKKNYTQKQIDKAILARRLHQELGWPSSTMYKK